MGPTRCRPRGQSGPVDPFEALSLLPSSLPLSCPSGILLLISLQHKLCLDKISRKSSIVEQLSGIMPSMHRGMELNRINRPDF